MNYKVSDPFRKGRIIQNILYLLIAGKILTEKIEKNAKVKEFGYFFPNIGELGKKISWPASRLIEGKDYLVILADMIKAGCFPCSSEKDDMRFTDYTDAIIDVEQAIFQIGEKMNNPDNRILDHMRKLRV